MNILIHGGVKTFIKINFKGKDKLHEIIIFLNKIVIEYTEIKQEESSE